MDGKSRDCSMCERDFDVIARHLHLWKCLVLLERRVEQRRSCGSHVIAAALFRHESPERSSIGMGWTTKKSSSMKRNEAAEQHALMNGRTDAGRTDADDDIPSHQFT